MHLTIRTLAPLVITVGAPPCSGFSTITHKHVIKGGRHWLISWAGNALPAKNMCTACVTPWKQRGWELQTAHLEGSKPSSSHLLHSCAVTTQKCQNSSRRRGVWWCSASERHCGVRLLISAACGTAESLNNNAAFSLNAVNTPSEASMLAKLFLAP